MKTAEAEIWRGHYGSGMIFITEANFIRKNWSTLRREFPGLTKGLRKGQSRALECTGLKKIAEVTMACPQCKWVGFIGECSCDADYPNIFKDEGRLRCPRCDELVVGIAE